MFAQYLIYFAFYYFTCGFLGLIGFLFYQIILLNRAYEIEDVNKLHKLLACESEDLRRKARNLKIPIKDEESLEYAIKELDDGGYALFFFAGFIIFPIATIYSIFSTIGKLISTVFFLLIRKTTYTDKKNKQ